MSLVELSVVFISCPPTPDIHAFCTAIQASCSHTSLESLDLTTHEYPPDAQHDSFIITNETIRTLFCFKNLTFISIMAPAGFDFDDSIIADMACSWPRVKTLLLQSDVERPPRNTLHCLYAIARNCPELEQLHITLDATAFAIGAHRAHQWSLKSLMIGRSPINARTHDVARIISAIFPDLPQLGAYELFGTFEDLGDDLNYIKYWREVATYLPVFAAIRAEERAWAREDLGA
ncbi:hypothetical protein FB451DRAFT_1058758 [Mycena latifolia]|nr:hypothetical protein FB451DRAFT_1058758 [Mycena latifolia]